MSWQSTAIALVVVAVLAFFAGRFSVKVPVVTEQVVVQTDTVIVWRDAEVEIVYRNVPATDTIGGYQTTTYMVTLDTLVVVSGDSISIRQQLAFDETKKEFDSWLDVKVRKMETVLIDSVYTTLIREVEVPAEQPFYDTFVFGSVFSIIALLVLAIFL